MDAPGTPFAERLFSARLIGLWFIAKPWEQTSGKVMHVTEPTEATLQSPPF